MATISNNEIARSIYLTSKDKSFSSESEFLSKVVRFLDKRHFLGRSKAILGELEKVVNKEEGRILVKVKSVEKLENKTKDYILRSLEKRYKGKEIIISDEIDKGLIGGLRIEVNDEVIDLSIRNKIKKLEEHLTRSYE